MIFPIDEPILSSSSIKNLNKNATINDKTPSVAETDFDDPMATVNDINSEISNDDCLSQSPLNLTRSQGLFSSISIFINIMHTIENQYIIITNNSYVYIFQARRKKVATRVKTTMENMMTIMKKKMALVIPLMKMKIMSKQKFHFLGILPQLIINKSSNIRMIKSQHHHLNFC